MLGRTCSDSRLTLSPGSREVGDACILLRLPSKSKLTVFHQLELRELVYNETLSNDACSTAQVKYTPVLWS